MNLTKHAIERAKDRLGWNFKEVKKYAKDAFSSGNLFLPVLGKRLVESYTSDRKPLVKYYRGVFFVFVDNNLVTLFKDECCARTVKYPDYYMRGVLHRKPRKKSKYK